jgi:hypothetical protein
MMERLYRKISKFSSNNVLYFLQWIWFLHMNSIFQCFPEQMSHVFRSGNLGSHNPLKCVSI